MHTPLTTAQKRFGALGLGNSRPNAYNDDDLHLLLPAISSLIRRVIRQDYASVALYEEANHCLRVYALDSPLADELIGPEMVVSAAEPASATGFLKGETKVSNREDLAQVRRGSVDSARWVSA